MIPLSLEQFETTKEEIGSALGNVKTGYFEAQKANIASSWDFNPTSSLFRLADQESAYMESSVYLNKDELNKEYAGMGLYFEQDTREGVVNYLVNRKQIEQERSSIMARGPQNTYGTFFLASMATNFLDPINIGAAFVPIVGEARFANMVARSGKNVARLQRGFVEGFVGNAGIEPIVYGVARSEQADYDKYDSFFNVAFGGIMGSTLHVGFGKIGDIVADKTGKPNIYQRLGAISPENQQDLLRYSVGKILKGEAVDTADVVINKTRIGDEQLSRIENQINEFKTLYKESVDKQDYNSAKVYLQNIRNLQKTERDIFVLKKQKNDLSIEQRKVDSAATQVNTLSPESNIVLKEKQTSDLVIEAENIVQRTKLQQKQLNIKDEYLLEKFSDDDKIIKEIDNTLNSKPTIKDSLNAGINCVIRSISG
jgi:hypothetical protein